MSKIPIFQVDTFTDTLFKGNPAAVCLLDSWYTDDIMQAIASENNLAETAFIVPFDNRFGIRWFTPTIEVDLCGHATLASAFVIYSLLGYSKNEIIFESKNSGILKVNKYENTIFLDFPTDELIRSDDVEIISRCIGEKPIELFKGKSDYIAIVENENHLKKLKIDILLISKLNSRGLIVTSKGDDVDFVSRFFAPQSGIDEDYVTGSSHTSLIPLWSIRLNKIKMIAKQLSKREGKIICEYKENRSIIGGKAKLYMKGEIELL